MRERSGQRGITPLEVLVLLTIAGGLLAVVVPAFRCHCGRSRVSEAAQNVGSLYRGAVAYYETEHRFHSTRTQETIPNQFPDSVGPTPALRLVTATRGRRFVGAPGEWDAPSWQALSFAISDPRHYAYEFVSTGTGNSAAFTARARGDLDADGVFSTFERAGSVDAHGSVKGSSGLYIDQELE